MVCGEGPVRMVRRSPIVNVRKMRRSCYPFGVPLSTTTWGPPPAHQGSTFGSVFVEDDVLSPTVVDTFRQVPEDDFIISEVKPKL